ncbi:MAG: FAD-dependent thymidylate synthase [Desulfovibrio sp.]|jgi:thymidylate synthase (FAD)|nr:FAD-dependent thymidylate synthase [Desulfovibrio sp.]
MEQTSLRVDLLSHTPDPLSLVYAAFRQCYHVGFAGDMWAKLADGTIDGKEQAAFVAEIMSSGHTSPVEHGSFTFSVAGVSRALSHQLVRHRMASYSQQSQRYVDGGDFRYVLPPAIARIPAARDRYVRCLEEIGKAYKEVRDLLEADGIANAREDARFLLPQAAETRLVLTMNCRSLLNFFSQRCCSRAQWEIRCLAGAMLALCREVLPAIFATAGPPCERTGVCPEGERFTCGKYPAFSDSDVFKKYK